jgi:hypothetical protein
VKTLVLYYIITVNGIEVDYTLSFDKAKKKCSKFARDPFVKHTEVLRVTEHYNKIPHNVKYVLGI